MVDTTPDFLRGKRVLVVEDEFLIMLDIERILEATGAEFRNVARNRDAISLLNTEQFDLAVLDYKLNGDTSLLAADRLIELGVPFIFLTGASVQDMPPKYRHAPLVAKPFDTVALLGALRTAIGRS